MSPPIELIVRPISVGPTPLSRLLKKPPTPGPRGCLTTLPEVPPGVLVPLPDPPSAPSPSSGTGGIPDVPPKTWLTVGAPLLGALRIGEENVAYPSLMFPFDARVVRRG